MAEGLEHRPASMGSSAELLSAGFADAPFEGSIADRFAAVAARFGARLAIQDAAVALTYAELAVLVNRIAAATAVATKGREGPVVLLLLQDATAPAAMLGVLAAGRAYVALDVDAPAERNALVVAEAGAAAVVSTAEVFAASGAWIPRELPFVAVDNLPEAAMGQFPFPHTEPDSLAAIYFTSGSSGIPKGVAWSHRTLLRWVALLASADRISPLDRLCLFFSPGVSASYRSVYAALLSGASLHVLSPRDLGVQNLVREMRARRVTTVFTMPALLRHIAEYLDGGRLDSVRIASLGGERVRWSDIEACRRCFSPAVSVCMSLSSTETGPTCYWAVDDALRALATWPPAGPPTTGWTVTIADDHGRPLPDGETGEVIVSSRYLALGYWDGAARRVLPFPADPAAPEQRVFNTGDFARRLPGGLVEYIGRTDQRIKRHGHRIEPAEVETALTALREVRDGAVLVRRDQAGVPVALVAYAVLRPGIRGLVARHVKAMLARRLPRHMVPAQIYLLDELPRLPNFKIDRVRLDELDAARPAEMHDRGEDPLLDKVARIYESIIQVTGAVADDNVESLGGDSLHAVNVQAELERCFRVSLPSEVVEQSPSIRQIAQFLAGHARSAEGV